MTICRLNCSPESGIVHFVPRPGLEPVSPALAGRFSTTAPPGKPPNHIFDGVGFLILSCMSYLYILEVNHLSVTSFANIFSHSSGSLLFCWWLLCCEKLFSLIKSYLFIFAFISFTLGDWSKIILLWFMSKSVLFSLLGILWFQVLHLGLYTILSLFLYMVWGNVLISLFYM